MHSYIGTLGSLLCIIALAITLFKNNFGESNNYKLLNFIGGSCLFYYALAINSIPFIILEGTWALLPVIAFVNNRLKSKNSQ